MTLVVVLTDFVEFGLHECMVLFESSLGDFFFLDSFSLDSIYYIEV